MNLLELAQQMGLNNCMEFDPNLLVPEWRVRELCLENKCGNYGNNYMCPPHIGALNKVKTRLKKFHKCVLFQYSQPVDVKNNTQSVTRIKVDFHNKILQLEECLKKDGIKDAWGLIGGSCTLCGICKARTASPCPYPDKARTSLESLGVDVVALLDRFGLDSAFHPDLITWTGCILY
jgi:predicted metal-binding protein